MDEQDRKCPVRAEFVCCCERHRAAARTFDERDLKRPMLDNLAKNGKARPFSDLHE
jgi:hypothetical protein